MDIMEIIIIKGTTLNLAVNEKNLNLHYSIMSGYFYYVIGFLIKMIRQFHLKVEELEYEENF